MTVAARFLEAPPSLARYREKLLPPAPQRDALRPSLGAVLLAGGASVALHLAAFAAFSPDPGVQIAGGGDTAPGALGTGFEDFVQGGIAAATPDTIQPHTPPPLLPAPAAPVASSAMTPLATLRAEEALLPLTPQPEATPEPESLAPAEPALPPEMVQPADPAAIRPEPDRAEPAPHTSPHPPARPEAPVRADPTPPVQSQAGNAPQEMQRGAPQGADIGTAATAPATRTAPAPGNAAAASYPGAVMERLQRVRRGRSPVRGTVTVVFSVAPTGALASVQVARSSGHPQLDEMALDHVRRAAPFPAPPTGAQREFRFEFEGR
ncbi:TonB family protein [Pararhodobacter sp. SW119]|uniref:TonB family protein n=1 Tax=Pararhodobacter sp. SW119 TaxID=2780075 RepID=UPI001ADEFA3F|nr:TonB family protein [Pararhodobacter sp. SW119]